MNTLKDYVNYKLTHADKAVEASGYPLKLENCKKHKKMRQLEIYGNSFQDGTPSPENPIEVQSVGELVTDETDTNYGKYKIPVVQRGKNLLKPTYVSAGGIRKPYPHYINNSYGTILDSTDLSDNTVDVIQTPNTAYGTGGYQNGYICIQTEENLIAGKKYILSFDVDIHDNPLNATYIDIYSNGVQPVYRSTSLTKRVRITFTQASTRPQPDSLPYVEIRCMGMSFTASNFMITEVDEDSEFEPYVEPIVTNVFLDEPLRKVGNEADYINFKENKVYRKIHKYYLDGSEKVTKYSDTICLVEFNVRCKLTLSVTGNCSHFSSAVGSTDIPWIIQANEVGQVVQISMYKRIDGVTDADTLKQWLKENPVTYHAVRETTKEESITLDLPKLNAKTTIIEVGTSLLPSNAYGKYIKK